MSEFICSWKTKFHQKLAFHKYCCGTHVFYKINLHYKEIMLSIEFVENYFPLYCRELMESNIFHKFRAMQFSTEFVGNNFPLEYRLQLVDEFTLYVLRVLSKDMISSHPIRVEATFRKLSFFINLVSSVYDGCAIK